MDFCTVTQVRELLLKHAIGYQGKESSLFLNGNLCLPKFVKRGIVRDYDVDEGNEGSSDDTTSSCSGSNNNKQPTPSVNCNIPGCLRTFDNIHSYESHYNALHRYGCSICHKNLPSDHLLDLHIQESHDSFFAVQAERKPMYACYVAECQHKSACPKERRDHCIRQHKFPHDFRFDIPPSKVANTAKMDVDGDVVKTTIPRTFHFGHNKAKGFVRPKKSILDSDTLMQELKESLPQS